MFKRRLSFRTSDFEGVTGPRAWSPDPGLLPNPSPVASAEREESVTGVRPRPSRTRPASLPFVLSLFPLPSTGDARLGRRVARPPSPALPRKVPQGMPHQLGSLSGRGRGLRLLSSLSTLDQNASLGSYAGTFCLSFASQSLRPLSSPSHPSPCAPPSLVRSLCSTVLLSWGQPASAGGRGPKSPCASPGTRVPRAPGVGPPSPTALLTFASRPDAFRSPPTYATPMTAQVSLLKPSTSSLLLRRLPGRHVRVGKGVRRGGKGRSGGGNLVCGLGVRA